MRWSEPGSVQTHEFVNQAQRLARPFQTAADLKPLIEKLSSKRIVMLGEASHGTHEFYQWRQAISRGLIEQHGFDFVAVEGDWPPCEVVNAFAQGQTKGSARDALRVFHRWPTWMWSNSDVEEFAGWLKDHNRKSPQAKKTGFFGLDVYSLFESIDEVLRILETHDARLAATVREHYSCFDAYHHDEKAYARSLISWPAGCERQAFESLKILLRSRLAKPGEAIFSAEQNARVVSNAENYYRTMVSGDGDSWNVRDTHMLETLEVLLDKYGPESKGIVWAHNTHIGDHRATDMVLEGQVNIGGLSRGKWGSENVALVGFGTHRGEVTASGSWGGPIQRLQVPPGRPGSLEDALHQVAGRLNSDAFFLDFEDSGASLGVLNETRGHRAIGVVYRPEVEQFGNYVPTSLAARYDAFVFIDQTHALKPLKVEVDRREIPETWPLGT